MLKFIGALVLLGFMTVVIVSLVQSFAVSVPEALMSVALQGLLGSIVISAVVVLIAYRAALVAETRATRWVRSVAGPNGRYAFGLLVLLWTGFMFALSILPPEPSGAPAEMLGGMALVGMFAGTFIFLGFIWSVITE